MSDEKPATSSKTIADDSTQQKISFAESKKPNFLNELRNLSISNSENKTSFPTQTNSSLTLNDLANAHLNKNTNIQSSCEDKIGGLKLNLDFNNLTLGTTINHNKNKHTEEKLTSNVILSKQAATQVPSISFLAKEHENSIQKLNNFSSGTQSVSTASGFKIPSLFGSPSNSIPSVLSTEKTEIAVNSTNNHRTNIDLSAALLSNDEKSKNQSSQNKPKLAAKQPSSAGSKSISNKELVDSIRLLIPSGPSIDLKICGKREPSPFGKVLCKNWNCSKRLKTLTTLSASPSKKYLLKNSKKIIPFMFGEPSPDDIIIAAQAKVFGRRQ